MSIFLCFILYLCCSTKYPYKKLNLPYIGMCHARVCWCVHAPATDQLFSSLVPQAVRDIHS